MYFMYRHNVSDCDEKYCSLKHTLNYNSYNVWMSFYLLFKRKSACLSVVEIRNSNDIHTYTASTKCGRNQIMFLHVLKWNFFSFFLLSSADESENFLFFCRIKWILTIKHFSLSCVTWPNIINYPFPDMAKIF